MGGNLWEVTLEAGRRSLGRGMLGILLLAALSGLLFNALMPQGIGWLPREVSQPRWQEVSLSRARALWEQGALFVDARDPGQYQLARVKGAVSIYPSEMGLLLRLLQSKLKKAPALVVYGRSFSRFPAAIVAQELKRRGFDRVLVMKAPFEEWRLAGYPTTEPRRRGRAS